MVKFYLAHPILKRYEVREQELQFEKKTGIQLINPFYDTYEKDVYMVKIDKGLMDKWDEKLDYERIVEKDLEAIRQCDGVVAVVYRTFSIGTFMELWYALTLKKPVYIVTKSCCTHPWLRYVAEKSGGVIIKNFKQLENVMLEWKK
jgi:nucleoside 2-deoxyribosyltransferase